MFLMCVASRRVWRMCLPVCLRCTVVDSSMTLFIGFLFLRIPTITCLHTGQMYLTRECPKPSKTILPNLPFAHPFLKTSWKPIHMAQRMAQADTSGAFGLEWVGPYALSFGSIIDLSAFPLSGVVLFMHSQHFTTGSAWRRSSQRDPESYHRNARGAASCKWQGQFFFAFSGHSSREWKCVQKVRLPKVNAHFSCWEVSWLDIMAVYPVYTSLLSQR